MTPAWTEYDPELLTGQDFRQAVAAGMAKGNHQVTNIARIACCTISSFLINPAKETVISYYEVPALQQFRAIRHLTHRRAGLACSGFLTFCGKITLA
jgi:hypothetical protein